MSNRFVRTEEEKKLFIDENVLEMLKFRGYEVNSKKDKKDISRVYLLNTENKYNMPKKLLVYKFEEGTESSNIRKLIDLMTYEYKVNNAIFISGTKLTSRGRKTLSDLIDSSDADNKLSITRFLINEFVVSPRVVNFDYQLLTKADKVKLLSEGEANPLLYPVVFKADPQSKYYGAKSRDMFRIVHRFNTGNKISYACVK